MKTSQLYLPPNFELHLSCYLTILRPPCFDQFRLLAKLIYNLNLMIHCASLRLPGLVFLVNFFIQSFTWCYFDSWQINEMVPPICYLIDFLFIHQYCVGHYIWSQLFWQFYSVQIEYNDIIPCTKREIWYFEIDRLH
jgi:hypothetical protein